MGTKNDPGKFDCYANAEPDEPMFVLLGRDSTAAFATLFWVFLKLELRTRGQSTISDDKLEEAINCATSMMEWACKKDKSPKQAMEAVEATFARLRSHLELLSKFDAENYLPKETP